MTWRPPLLLALACGLLSCSPEVPYPEWKQDKINELVRECTGKWEDSSKAIKVSFEPETPISLKVDQQTDTAEYIAFIDGISFEVDERSYGLDCFNGRATLLSDGKIPIMLLRSESRR